ncbi:endonuclease/exonuclease/phosphatase family protein [Trifolium medium]|uniref:Endonuclease/exonuclease/phosphatase family protein n=1 Tax=Trifolium medium TaxID=97028 RepID=A0A392M5G9_9FABA|nr:endonuclease/exonuclease/phosphatase family protein [Trifolium medium]
MEHEHLNLDEEDEIEIPEEELMKEGSTFNPELCLVGRFLTNKPVWEQHMMDHMAGVWTPPWEKGKRQSKCHLINTVPFWVQVHHLPAGYISKTVGQNVGDYIGELLDYDEKNSSDFWRKYMGIRVMVDVRKPLPKSKKIKKKGAEAIIVQLQYEKLGRFCYYCGILGHTEDSCNKLYSLDDDDETRKWGLELRIEARRKTSNDGGRWRRTEVPTLCDLVQKYRADVIFLCETLVHANKIEEVRVRLGFDASFAVDRVGRSGGLAILWKHPFDCNLINFSSNFINIEVNHPTYPKWRFTGFYGYRPDGGRRHDSWNLLRTLAQDNSLPWCIMGDFNDILSNDDKRSRVEHPPWRIRGFRSAVQDNNLTDLDRSYCQKY